MISIAVQTGVINTCTGVPELFYIATIATIYGISPKIMNSIFEIGWVQRKLDSDSTKLYNYEELDFKYFKYVCILAPTHGQPEKHQ